VALACFLLLALTGCGQPAFVGAAKGNFPLVENSERPEDVKDFTQLFEQNCQGCHGANGRNGGAPPLNDPLFLAIVPEEVLRDTISNGRKGTLMPPFARSQGGPLTDEQVTILVRGIHEPRKVNDWPREKPPDNVPDYRLGKPGDAKNGEMVFDVACSSCHGPNGKGGDAGALRDPSFLALISDQELRRIVITGRPDFGMPNYKTRQNPSFTPLTNQDVADVVALLASWRKGEANNTKESARAR
jgi:mono/diheme cytochrome c family protein